MGEYPYLHVASAADLEGSNRRLYRVLEILPAALACATLIGVVLLSWLAPVAAAIFIIIFDLYWLIKTVFLSLHLRANARRLQQHLSTDWQKKLEELEWSHVWQLVILPFYKEEVSVLRSSLNAIVKTPWPKDRMIIVLAREERAGESAMAVE